MDVKNDENLALLLQEQYYSELNGGSIDINDEISSFLPTNSQLKDAFKNSPIKAGKAKETEISIVAPEWEDLDPTPDLHAMFLQYNKQFFWGRLNGCEVLIKSSLPSASILSRLLFFRIIG